MKALKYLIVPLVVASVVFVACQKEEEGGEGGGPTGRARWTIIGYLDGNNNLDISQNNTSYVIADAQDMEAVGSTNNVQIIIALGSLKTGGVVKYYHIEHFENELPDSLSSPVLRNLGSKDMSDPATLTEFIQYAVQHYPADHYLLLIDDHGGGWRGCCVDEQNGAGDLMSMPELRQAIEEANVHFDIILFHACLMGQVEVAYELKDVADYVVASEFTMPMLSVLGAQEWLGALVDTPNMSARDLASRIVEAVYNSGQHQQKYVHMAAIDLSKMDALASKLSTFANRLLDSGGDHWDEIIHAWGQTHYTQYDDPAFVDLREYVKNVKLEPNLGQIPVIRDAADQLIDAINDAVVITMTNVPGLTRGGMTIHFPYEEAQYDSANYARLRFRATNWIGFLRQFLDHVGGGGGATIHINSNPQGATIWYDGQNTGATTPATLENVPEGQHTIGLRLEGYIPWDTTLTVQAGQTYNINVTLTPQGGGNQVTISGTVIWPGHNLSNNCIAFLDTSHTQYIYIYQPTQVDPTTGQFTITFTLDHPIEAYIEAWDDVDGNGQGSVGDGLGWYDANNNGQWDDMLVINPGDQLTDVVIYLQEITQKGEAGSGQNFKKFKNKDK
ncbi:MAG: hypothetical protein DRQ10_03370 [Candidatus Hydrothermota bacterium]|nr:MAG: hypothetical protein DRQ10_03370 [Candidatus Hydrothermae bacterium]